MGCEGQSYNERRVLKFGTLNERIGKDSVKDFNACGLTLQIATDPVVTSEGVLFSKEAIFENLLKQKKSIQRQLTAWESQQSAEDAKADAQAVADKESALAAFHSQNHGAGKWETVDMGPVVNEEGGGANNSYATDFERIQNKEMKAFWLPSKTPDAKVVLAKPDTSTKCPVTGKKLRLKDLVDVKWTPAPKDSSCLSMCPSCKTCFYNATHIVVVKGTGDALCKECCAMVEKEGNFNGKVVRKRDLIQLQRGGVGYSASGTQVEAKRFSHLGAGSGLCDVRGQHAGPRSAFGLRY
eukprot:CAMPEP_0196571466 /NCGR_PEP_ID=MMETSP1081-20130531/1644_1 /TAXON_ID=36882 /ORGANISM="Pyramimonas amylifera, Strain CCMP720" /LENGTH=295 /DNA_ID=CAMNT_0041888429 /DNA_START=147 /DNA_END=1034 /DNA_ORIENTATION=+